MTLLDSSFSGVRMVADDAVTNNTFVATRCGNLFIVRASRMRLFFGRDLRWGLSQVGRVHFLEIGKGCRIKVRDQPRWTKLLGGRNCNRVPYPSVVADRLKSML